MIRQCVISYRETISPQCPNCFFSPQIGWISSGSFSVLSVSFLWFSFVLYCISSWSGNYYLSTTGLYLCEVDHYLCMYAVPWQDPPTSVGWYLPVSLRRMCLPRPSMHDPGQVSSWDVKTRGYSSRRKLDYDLVFDELARLQGDEVSMLWNMTTFPSINPTYDFPHTGILRSDVRLPVRYPSWENSYRPYIKHHHFELEVTSKINVKHGFQCLLQLVPALPKITRRDDPKSIKCTYKIKKIKKIKKIIRPALL